MKREQPARLDGLILGEAQAIVLCHMRDHHDAHGQRQRGADAETRTDAEGDVRATRMLVAPLRRETRGVEALRRLPQRTVAMDDPGDDSDNRTGGNGTSANLVPLQRLAPCERVNRGEEPERLVEDHARVGQAANVVVGGCLAIQPIVHFRPDPLLDLRMLRQQEPCPAERQSRGFVPGDKDGDHLVAHVARR